MLVMTFVSYFFFFMLVMIFVSDMSMMIFVYVSDMFVMIFVCVSDMFVMIPNFVVPKLISKRQIISHYEESKLKINKTASNFHSKSLTII